uniref:Cilia and flagella associated protein 92 (putative) n=1 Tax=Rhinolophus ferrumequinum TaxID=59479 RepID=A0A671E149_RHIFE
MSLHAGECKAEDEARMPPRPSRSGFSRSASECGVENLTAGAQARDSASERQCSSVASSHGPAIISNSDEPQVVPCNFIISLAFPVNIGHKGKYTSLIEKYRKNPKMDKPIAKFRRFYHIEYFLLPDDGEPKIVDMVVFPAVVKVFLDSGVKTVRPWHEGDKVWVSWSQIFNINMTKELLKKINFHKITLRLWDSKDKVSRKVRYYRLKTAGYSEDAGSSGKSEEVRHLVLNQKKLFGIHVKEEWDQEYAPGKPEKAGKHLKSLHGSHAAEPETLSRNTEEYEKLLRTEDLATVGWNISRLPTISLGGATVMEMKKFIERPSFSSLTKLLEKQKFQIKQKESEGKMKSQKRRKKSRAEEETDSKMAGRWTQGSFSIQLAVMPLLAGWQTIISRGSGRSANILDCFLTLKTEVPIMTEEQKQDLNPLTIRIKCVSCLPSQPVPIHELERLCTPVYCRYQFHKTPVHQTEGKPHGSHVSFQDINVIFLGAIHPSDLREYLEGPPMVVEVHDRDRKSEDYSQKPTLFGEDPLDSYLNFQALISLKATENNPFESQNKMWDPHGVAQVSFSDLLLGHKYLNLVVPIHSCEPKPIQHGQISRSRKVVGFQVPANGLHHGPMPTGNYLDANSLLKLRVDIAVPLQTRAEAPGPGLTRTQFGCIIFVFDSREILLLYSLLQDITRINAKALDLDSYPINNIQHVLAAFKMRVKIQEMQDLDVLTGFHLLDGKMHLLILEGLAAQGLKQLWESHQSRMTKSEYGKCKVLYNSQLLFQHRHYADLETILYHVHLFQPLSQLMKHTALYVRNAVPQEAFQALTRIYCICHHSTRLREVITRDLLPSSTMIKDLSREFGLPISQEELTDRKFSAMSPLPAPNLEDFRGRNPTPTYEILAHQEKYLQWQDTVMLKNKGQKHSLIQKNITGAHQVSKKPPKPMVKVIRISAPIQDAVYNYSVQTLNSTALAKKELHREMAKAPRKRFTYSKNHLSAMVEPQDSGEEQKKAKKKCRQAWLTANGVQGTGLQSSTESNPHLGLLPTSSTTGLTEGWRENTLFANVLGPVLDRGRWSWHLRHRDFDLYRKPPHFLELPAPLAVNPVPGRKKKGSGPVS